MPKSTPFPTKAEILTFMRESEGTVGRREIARAFHITGADRNKLRAVLKELESDGSLKRDRGKRVSLPGALPEVAVLVLHEKDPDGDFLCRLSRQEDDAEAEEDENNPRPRIELRESDRGRPSNREGGPYRVGDRILARLTKIEDGLYTAKPIRRLAQGPIRILGVVTSTPDGLRLVPTSRKDFNEYRIVDNREVGAGAFVEAELVPGRKTGLRSVRITRVLGDDQGAHFISQVAVETYEIPDVFPPAAVEQAEAAGPVTPAGRVDLRDIPLVTIDGEDARDFDDAVFAQADDNPANPEGWVILVAIADVAHYVPPGSPLDVEAFERGNSVYFPDRVVPMLPEALSNGWCSLKPNEDRGCLVARITITKRGEILSHKFARGLMRSAARLTYAQVQSAMNGHPDDTTRPLLAEVIEPLYGAWAALSRMRAKRGSLDLDLPETKVIVNEQGYPTAILPRLRLDSHRVIEDFMIAANVSAAETLERRGEACLYRIHDQPSPEKARALFEFLNEHGIPFHKGTIKRASQFNGVLDAVRGTAQEHMINEMVLRSQAQAEYSPDNIGHFGLSLHRYAHFTSPIRRYADLVVHRALIRAVGLGSDGGSILAGLPLDDIGRHITATERRAAQAEREAVLRATALFLARDRGAEFQARVNGVSRAGLFVTLDKTGASGFVPFTGLPSDYYIHDEQAHRLTGERTGLSFSLGEALLVRLGEINTISGRLTFEWVDGGTVVGKGDGRRKRGRGKAGPPKRGTRR